MLLAGLNATIQGAAQAQGAVFVPTVEAFAKHTELYLPIENIHPSAQGYRALAKEFWSYMKTDL